MDISDMFENVGVEKWHCDNSLTGRWEDYSTPGESFRECLKIEKLGQPIADEFYTRYLHATQIRRYDYKNPSQRFLQDLDVDCSIQLYAKSLDVFWLNFSEKFRQWDTGDMCIELWSDFEGKKQGWAVKPLSTNEGPDYYLYVTPKHFYEVCVNRYFYDMVKKVSTEWDWDTIDRFIQKQEKDFKRGHDSNGRYPCTVWGHDAELLKTWTRVGDKEWYGICICIPWKTLFNEFLLDINMFDRDYNKLNINKEYE